MTSDDDVPERAYLSRVAYRMLGSLADADDVVQDAFLRWSRAPRDRVESPRAFLTRVVVRLCLDRLKSARARREHYVGTWLPEPVVEPPERVLADELSLALLVALERLSPLERAAFLLHDTFDMSYDDIAELLGSSPAAVRQLASRARTHVRDERPRFVISRDDEQRIADGFYRALITGDLAGFATLLADDAVFYSDGGGKRPAATRPVIGSERIVRLVSGLIEMRGGPPAQRDVMRVAINGMHGVVIRAGDGVETLAIEIANGQITALYSVRNPDKLHHVAALVGQKM